MEIGHDQVVYSHHFAKGTTSDKHATHEVCDVLLDRIKSALIVGLARSFDERGWMFDLSGRRRWRSDYTVVG